MSWLHRTVFASTFLMPIAASAQLISPPSFNSLVSAAPYASGYFGAAATGNASWVDTYWSGAQFQYLHSVYSVNPYGLLGGLFATRTSENTVGASSNVIAIGGLLVEDNGTTGHGSLVNYYQSNLIAGGGAGYGHLQTESSIYNAAWTAGTLDPYTDNAASQVVNYRIDCGIGSGTPLPCSAPLQIITNGSTYKSGIIVGNGSITADGSSLYPSFELPKNHTIDWFSGAGAKAWRLYSSAASGSNTLVLGATAATISSNLGVGTAVSPLLTGKSVMVNAASSGSNPAGYEVWAGGTLGAYLSSDAVNYAALYSGGAFVLNLGANNAAQMVFTSGGGVQIGAPTGGDKGADTLNIKGAVYNNGGLVWSPTAPTIASGGCTTGSAQSVSQANGTAAFEITLGGATCGSTITLTLPAAAHKWVCDAHDITTPASNTVEQSAAASTTSVVLTNYARTTGLAANFTGADVLAVKCSAY